MITIIAYIILGLIVAVICSAIALYVGGFIYFARHPEKLLKSHKLMEEMQQRKQNNTVCEVCITMRKPTEIAVIVSHLTDPPFKLRYCAFSEECREGAFIRLREKVHEWKEAKIKELQQA